LEGDPPRAGGLDVLAQHVLGGACAGPFLPEELYAEVRRASPYAALSRRDFRDVLEFVEHGGYSLAAYHQFRKLFRDSEGRVQVMGERVARQHRMNIGTIVEEPMIKVRLAGRGGGTLGEVEEYFVNGLVEGDTFMFAGRLLRFVRLRETWIEVVEGGFFGTNVIPADYPAEGEASPEMLANGAKRSGTIVGQVGWYHADANPTCRETWVSAEAAAACAIAAADEAAAGRHAYALARPPACGAGAQSRGGRRRRRAHGHV
jgi:hypothetical protein